MSLATFDSSGVGKNADLKTRLMELHDRLPEELKTRLQLNVDRWADWSVWARNHVAHGGTKKHRKISHFYQLKTIADSVRLVTYLAVKRAALEFDIRRIAASTTSLGGVNPLAVRMGQLH